MRKFLLITFSSILFSGCAADIQNIAELKPGSTFGDARRAADAAEGSFDCMEMDHPEEGRMTMECISSDEHLCYSFSEKDGVFVLDSSSCGEM